MVLSGPRLQLVPPRRQPRTRWLLREGYLTLKRGRRRQRGVAARRRLVAARKRVLPRADRHVPERQRPRGAGHRRARRRGAGAQGRDHRQAEGPARRGEDARSASAKRSITATLYSGPYLENGPDLIIGYNAGYRASWDCASGVISGPVFEDNVKAWSGDHCIDPRLVPGVFFCSRSDRRRRTAHRRSSRPPRSRLFGIQPPAHMDGKAFRGGRLTWHAIYKRCR